MPLSRETIAVGADGLLVEVQYDPSHALRLNASLKVLSIVQYGLLKFSKVVRKLLKVHQMSTSYFNSMP